MALALFMQTSASVGINNVRSDRVEKNIIYAASSIALPAVAVHGSLYTLLLHEKE